MSQVMVRYKVKPKQVAENEALARGVYEALAAEPQDGLKYMTFKSEDGVTFVHIAIIETADGSNPLPAMPAFQAFVKDLAARCSEPPSAIEMELIGACGLAD